MFTDELRTQYRVVETKYGNGESEETIPLGSWRKGGGLAGSRGHVYHYGEGWAGVWLIHRHAIQSFDQLREKVPSIVLLQLGVGEMTFRVPYSDLPAVLPLVWAKRRFQPSERLLATLEKARSASPVAKVGRFVRTQKA